MQGKCLNGVVTYLSVEWAMKKVVQLCVYNLWVTGANVKVYRYRVVISLDMFFRFTY